MWALLQLRLPGEPSSHQVHGHERPSRCAKPHAALLLRKKLWRQQQDGAHAGLTLLRARVHCDHALCVGEASLLLGAALHGWL